MIEKTYTADEVATLMNLRRRKAPHPVLPEKLKETGAQTAYTGILSLIVVMAVWLLDQFGVIAESGVSVEAVIGSALALVGAGGGYRFATKRQQTSAEANVLLAQDIGALPDEDEYGPER